MLISMAATLSDGSTAAEVPSASSSHDAAGDDDLLDEAYLRFHATSPEYQTTLANHGPMAVDALLRLGAAPLVSDWVSRYVLRLEPVPAGRWPITESEWREPLGDPSRLGDWLRFFARALVDEPWQEVVHRWWPRLLPGGAAAATHGIIRTGHAVRALRVRVTAPRTAELAHALAYWSARWQPLPTPSHPLAPGEEQYAVGVLPHALTTLTDNAVSSYVASAHGNPVGWVHAATAPRAAALVLPSIPHEQWAGTYATARVLAAAAPADYHPVHPPTDERNGQDDSSADLAPDAVVAEAVSHHQDEHVLKFVEVALESHRRGNRLALPAARRAITLIERPR